MKHDELRRLAIRLARRPFETGGINHERCSSCNEFGEVNPHDPIYALEHKPNCPIAALEAEEAAGASVITLTGEGWTKVDMQWDGVQRECWVQLGSIEVKPAGKFEGEY
jgi:hypothetical protein